MAKNKYWKLEYSVALFVMLGVVLLMMPISIGNTMQANFISKWNETYNRVGYMYKVINAHVTSDLLKSFNHAKSSEEREKLLLQLVKPYLRINTETTPPKQYKPKYMNKVKSYKGQLYNFEEFYYAENGVIVGIKDLPKTQNVTSISIEADLSENDAFMENKLEINNKIPMFIMMFDLNGILLPNTWGKDIYGVNIYDGGKIEPFGQEMDMNELKKDCSPSGSGISCSYYYIIGGGFED